MSTNKVRMLGTMNPNSSQRRIVYDKNYISPCLQAAMGCGGSDTNGSNNRGSR